MALSTSLTKVTRVGLSSFQNYEINAVTAVGVATFSNFKTGLSNVHDIGFDVVSNTGTGATIRSTGNAAFSGIVTAAGFVGDGSGLIGVASTDNINTSTLAKLSGGMVVGGAVTFTGTVEGAADIVFLGFKRDANSNLILYYTEKGNTDTFETKDYEHKGGAQWLMGSGAHLHSTSSLAAIGSTTRPDGSTPQVGEPKYRFIPSGHLTINI
tara:strand:- start:1539 stop:2171 length:633 start_codon:yes stop_codon:yes gene_type:complete